MTATLTTSEWLHELLRVQKDSDNEAVTVSELAAMLGRPSRLIRERLGALQRTGTITLNPTTKRIRAIDGRETVVSAYRIRRVKAQKAPAKASKRR